MDTEALLEHSWQSLGGILGAPWRPLGASWALMGAKGGPGPYILSSVSLFSTWPSWARLGGVLGASEAVSGYSGAPPEPLLGLLGAVKNRKANMLNM